jgi:hypothetical protein
MIDAAASVVGCRGPRSCRGSSRRRSWRLAAAVGAAATERRYTVAFANATEEPGVSVEGTGFTGAEIRQSFVLAARTLPIDLGLLRQPRRRCARHRECRGRDRAQGRSLRAVPPRQHGKCHRGAKAEGRRHPGAGGQRAGTGRAALQPRQRGGRAHRRRCAAQFARRTWAGQPTFAVVIGRVSTNTERVQGVADALRKRSPSVRVSMLETQGNPAQVAPLLGPLLATQPTSKVLIAATDDATALAAKAAVEAAGRARDAASSAMASIAASTVAPTTARSSTRPIAPASCSGRWRSISIAWAIRCCRSRCACCAASPFPPAPPPRTS